MRKVVVPYIEHPISKESHNNHFRVNRLQKGCNMAYRLHKLLQLS